MSKTKHWINFCGVSSESIAGLLINELPPIQMPPKRINKIEIEGRDGDIIEELGYMSYDRPVQLSIIGDCDIDKVFGWLNNSGNIIFSNEPNKVYKATVCDTVAFERLVRFKKASVKFHTQPFKTLYNELLRFVADDGTDMANLVIKNQGNIYSRPTIEVDLGSTTWLDMKINGEATRIIIEEDGNHTVVLNLENGKITVLNSQNVEVEPFSLRYPDGGIPFFKPGDNTLSLVHPAGHETDIRGVTIANVSRWL